MNEYHLEKHHINYILCILAIPIKLIKHIKSASNEESRCDGLLNNL